MLEYNNILWNMNLNSNYTTTCVQNVTHKKILLYFFLKIINTSLITLLIQKYFAIDI